MIDDEQLKNKKKMYKRKIYNVKTSEEIANKIREEEKQKKYQRESEELRSKIKSEILKEIERLKRIKEYNNKIKEKI